jgi:hypothetical protein
MGAFLQRSAAHGREGEKWVNAQKMPSGHQLRTAVDKILIEGANH